MSTQLFFIGGASASGKSTAAEKLGREHNIGVIKLDDIYNIVCKAVGENEVSRSITRQVSIFTVEQLLETDTKLIVEGGWISVRKSKELIDKLGNRFTAVFCGYPNTTVDERLAEIHLKDEHWLVRKTTPFSREWIERQIKESLCYKTQCQQYGIAFFDFSELSRGEESLRAHFNNWFK